MNSSNKVDCRLEQWMPLFQERLCSGNSVRFSPNGVSMLPLLRQGRDQVILSPLPDRLEKYDVPLYRRDNGQFVLHRVIRVSETYTCIGDNQFAEEPGLRHEQMIAVMTGFVRNGKEHSVTELPYRLYCRFWHLSRPVRFFFRRAVGYIRRHLT